MSGGLWDLIGAPRRQPAGARAFGDMADAYLRPDETTPAGLAPGQMPVDPARDGSVQPTAAGKRLSGVLGGAAVGIAGGLLDAAKLPGDVYAGRVDPLSDEGFRRAQDLAGLAMTGGIGGVAKEAGEAVLGSGPIRAYHGSPHDFDRFDISKLGTGEGNQAFGHGLYFAENEGIAKHYRDMGAGMITPKLMVDDKPYDWLAGVKSRDVAAEFADLLSGKPARAIDPQAAAGEAMTISRADPSLAVDTLRFQAGAADPAAARAYEEAIRLIESGRMRGEMSIPRMYEVAIDADPARFLQYDMPLAGQPRVREVLGDLGGAGNAPDLTAGRAMLNVQDAVPPATVATALREAGVPGVRYHDAASRGANQVLRSLNTVTFSDDIVSILRKYGIPGMVGAGGAAALAPDDARAAPAPQTLDTLAVAYLRRR